MDAWSTTSKLGLAIAFCVMFTIVVLLAGRGTATKSQAPGNPARAPHPALAGARRDEVARKPEPPAPTSREARPMDTSPAAEPADFTELSRQAMPLAETSAEEDEQRGDAIRRLGAGGNPQAIPALVHAARNDVDIRNRILAIDGLRRAALAGNTDRAIIDVLTDASRSGDEVIASQASQALAEIDIGRR